MLSKVNSEIKKRKVNSEIKKRERKKLKGRKHNNLSSHNIIYCT
jgi:hypothetical protein